MRYNTWQLPKYFFIVKSINKSLCNINCDLDFLREIDREELCTKECWDIIRCRVRKHMNNDQKKENELFYVRNV